MSDLERAWDRAVLKTVLGEGVPAELGNDAGTIYFVDESGTTHGGTVWVRFVDKDGTVTEVAVNNSALPTVYGLPVLLVNRDRGLTAIIDIFGYRMQRFTDNGGWMPLQQHGFTHRVRGTDPRYVEGLAMEPLLVKPSSPAAMTVYVIPGWYDWNGNEDVWEGGDSGSLSGYIPGAAGTIHFVIVCLDSSTNAIVVVDGADIDTDDIYSTASVGYNDIEAISINQNYIPLAVVELVDGQTSILASDITFDLRRWITSSGNSAATGGGWVVNYNAEIQESTHAYIAGKIEVLDGYTLTIKGGFHAI